MPSNSLELVALGGNLLVSVADLDKCLLPSGGLELAIGLDERVDQTLCAESVASESSLVVDPFLVDVVVQAGNDPHDLEASRVNTDV
jgi:hypothetical protein